MTQGKKIEVIIALNTSSRHAHNITPFPRGKFKYFTALRLKLHLCIPREINADDKSSIFLFRWCS